jgi:hypothetical protein
MATFINGVEQFISDPNEQIVIKASNEAVSDSTTLQNDDELVLPVEANSQYILRLYLRYTAPTTSGVKTGWAVPSGATMAWAAIGSFTLAFGTAGALSLTEAQTGHSGTATATDRIDHYIGLVNVGATAGNVQLQWAQFNQTVEDTVVKADSYLKLTKVA